MICCYIIFSEKLNRFYIGATQNGVEQRLLEHNNQFYGSSVFTATTNDWKLFLSIECNSFSQALRIEKGIKKMKSRKYLENLKKYPSMIEQLKAGTKDSE